MVEAPGLSKIMGHPFCDMKETTDDLYLKTHEERFVDLDMVQEAVRCAKQDFVGLYISKNCECPPVQLDNTAHPVIVEAHNLGIDPRRATHQTQYGMLRNVYWDAVTLGKCEKFDRLENFIPYVKDRTVSLCRTAVLNKYFRGEGEEEQKTDWRETRALLAYLLLPYNATEHLSYMELYANEDWEMMSDLLVIRLVPKEKEHKVKARCFGCKPTKERARTIVLGHNASKFLHRYSDSEAMTLSELTLSKKLAAFRNMYHAYKNYSQIIICLDASGWNSRLRDAALGPVAGQVLDPIFGEHMYGQFHITYTHMFIYLPDSDEVYHWYGQDGGIEGLDQYPWVHSYIAHLKTILGRLGYPFQLIVKGDDARVVILIPPQLLQNRTVEEIRAELVQELTQGAARFGHLMKPEDSYGSEVYCSFSKNAFIRNVEQPQSFRKCQKAYGANNAFLNTVDDYVASSFSNCHSTAKTSPSPISCYMLALWWMLVALLRHPVYSKLSDAALTAMTLIPNLLGGFPVIFLHNFYQRAESDLLSSYIEIYEHARRQDPDVGEYLGNAWSQKVLDPRENVELICMDPYSLPLYKPPQAQSILRRHLRTTITQMTQNRMIKDLFRARKSELHEAVVTCLRSMTIYNPKIMSTIFSCTPEGIIMELVTKFESGKSVMDAIILKKNYAKGRRVLAEAARADDQLHEFRLKMIKGRIAGSTPLFRHSDQCSAEKAQTMRESLWQKPIEAITQPSVFHLVTVGTLAWFFSDRTSDRRHFEIKWNPGPDTADGSIFREGPFTAFLGDSTSKGLTHPEVKIMSENIFALKIVKLLDVYKWSVPTDECPNEMMSVSELCAMLIQRYTGRSIEELLPFSSERPFGKTTQHHLRANQYRPSIIPNTLQNVYTWIQVNMLTHIQLAGSPEHYKINFHEIKCWATSVLASRSWIGMLPPPTGMYWAVTTTCTFCLTPIHEQSIWCKRTYIPSVDLYEHFEDARTIVKEINQEIEMFTPELYLIADQNDQAVTPIMAAQAICQFVCDAEWEQTKIFEDTYAGHAISTKGVEILRDWTGLSKTNIITFEDLRYVNIKIIFHSLLPLVVGTIHERFPSAYVHNVGAVLSSVPPEMLPWSSILYHLHHVQRSRELQDYVSRQVRAGEVLVMDNYLTYAARFGAHCYRYWKDHPTEHLSLTVMTNKADPTIRKTLRPRLNAYRRAVFNRIYDPYNDDRQPRDLRERMALEVIIATCRYYTFDQEYMMRRGIHNEILETEIHIINLEEDIAIEDIVRHIDHVSPLLFGRLSTRYAALPIAQTLDLLRHDDDVVLDLIPELDAQVLRRFYHIPLQISRIDVLTCKNRIKEFQAHRQVQRRALHQNEAWVPDITWGVTGQYIRIRPFQREQCRLNISPEHSVELRELAAVDMTPVRVTADGWCYRPLGAFNISMTRYAYIFQQLNIRDLGEHRFIACFADGYGGCSRVVGKLTRYSQILFVTSPTTSNETPIPYGIENDGRNNRVLTEAVQHGRWDLRETTNMMALEQDYRYAVNLCTCDAELPPTENPAKEYEQIWGNVCCYWLRNASPNGLLILKVYMTFYDLVLRLIAFIRPYASTIYLLWSNGSSWNHETFLIAVFAGPADVNYIPLPRLYPTVVRVRSVVTYWHNYVARFRAEQLARDFVTLTPRYPRLIQSLCLSLPSYGWSQLEIIVRTGEPMHRLRLRRNEDTMDYVARMMEVLNRLIRPLDRELLEGVYIDVGDMAALYHTRNIIHL